MAHLAAIERAPGVVADRRSIANRLFFRSPEAAASVDLGTVATKVSTLTADSHPYSAIQREFEEGRADFARQLREDAMPFGRLECNHPADFDRFMVSPDASAGWVALFDESYSSPAWQASLRVFPDQHAVGRWWRIALWYWLREARGLGKRRLRNDWADSVYVFTASYADQFWSADDEAARLVRLLFPQTEVLFLTPHEIGLRH